MLVKVKDPSMRPNDMSRRRRRVTGVKMIKEHNKMNRGTRPDVNDDRNVMRKMGIWYPAQSKEWKLLQTECACQCDALLERIWWTGHAVSTSIILLRLHNARIVFVRWLKFQFANRLAQASDKVAVVAIVVFLFV
jgi:hypothetical protein